MPTSRSSVLLCESGVTEYAVKKILSNRKKSRYLVDTFGSKIFSLLISVFPRGKWMLPFLFFLALFFSQIPNFGISLFSICFTFCSYKISIQARCNITLKGSDIALEITRLFKMKQNNISWLSGIILNIYAIIKCE